MVKNDGDLSKIATRTLESLTKEAGIGKDKAATLLAAFELGRRIQSQQKKFSNKKITSPEDIAKTYYKRNDNL